MNDLGFKVQIQNGFNDSNKFIVFDGQDHTISNIYFNLGVDFSLFHRFSQVKNINFKDCLILAKNIRFIDICDPEWVGWSGGTRVQNISFTGELYSNGYTYFCCGHNQYQQGSVDYSDIIFNGTVFSTAEFYFLMFYSNQPGTVNSCALIVRVISNANYAAFLSLTGGSVTCKLCIFILKGYRRISAGGSKLAIINRLASTSVTILNLIFVPLEQFVNVTDNLLTISSNNIQNIVGNVIYDLDKIQEYDMTIQTLLYNTLSVTGESSLNLKDATYMHHTYGFPT